jgi:hypothetical protein
MSLVAKQLTTGLMIRMAELGGLISGILLAALIIAPWNAEALWWQLKSWNPDQGEYAQLKKGGDLIENAMAIEEQARDLSGEISDHLAKPRDSQFQAESNQLADRARKLVTQAKDAERRINELHPEYDGEARVGTSGLPKKIEALEAEMKSTQ